MAILSNPFVMEVPRKLTDEELVNAIRQDLVGELEAIHEYDAHVQPTMKMQSKCSQIFVTKSANIWVNCWNC